MNRDQILQMLENIDDRFVTEAARFDPVGRRSPTERSRHMKMKRIVTLALAIYRQRQEELRQELQIDENKVEDYVEYPVAQEPEEVSGSGATLLSTMNDGEFQRIWVVLNGMTPEMIQQLEHTEQVDWEGRKLPANGHRYCWIRATLDGESFFDAMSLNFQDGYDPESQTLTTECAIPLDELEEGRKVTLTFVMMDTIDYEMDHSEGELVCELGSVEAERTGQSIRTVWFPEPVPFENGAYGKGVFLGAEISAAGVNWILRHDGVSQMYRPRSFANEEERLAYSEMELSWITVIEEVEPSEQQRAGGRHGQGCLPLWQRHDRPGSGDRHYHRGKNL